MVARKAANEEGEAPLVAAIDVGSNALRMVIAQVLDDGALEVLERMHRGVRLGQDTFRRGRLGSQSMQAAVAVLKDFRRVLHLFHVGRIRAVATSAVREANNADMFLDRVFMATGLHLEVIDTSEESRLTVSAVRQVLEQALPGDEQETLIADVGGGSTLLTVLQGAQIVTSQSMRLGSIRLQEMFATSEEAPRRSAELLRQHISNVVCRLEGSLPLGQTGRFVALGGDARFAAREIGQPAGSPELATIAVEDFDRLVARCVEQAPEELTRRYGLPFAEAETLGPALLVYQALVHRTRARRLLVSDVSMRDGLLLELAREVTGRQDEAVLAGVLHSAMVLAEKYRADTIHARNVAELAGRLFDETKADHGLGPRQRLLLQVAAWLHEIGGFVSVRAHHKHSYYLIANAEIFGLSREEIGQVALVARYHRRSPPKPSHLEYMSLGRELRVMVSKLAAILRVADALARNHSRDVSGFHFQRQGDELVISVPAAGGDLLLEERALAAKGDMFEEIYGVKIRIEET